MGRLGIATEGEGEAVEDGPMIRIGVDFGGTKIEAARRWTSAAASRRRESTKPNPGDYEGALQAVCEVVREAEAQAGVKDAPIGVGMPGSLSPKTGRMRNANGAASG